MLEPNRAQPPRARRTSRSQSANEKLAASLAVLADLRKSGRSVIRSRELSRTHRERLVRNGFLKEVIKGWLIPSDPVGTAGESAGWYASFWEFCAAYCDERFGSDWTLSPEESLLRHTDNRVVPEQVIVYSTRGSNHVLELPFGSSLMDVRQRPDAVPAATTVQDGLRLYSPEDTLIAIPAPTFRRHAVDVQLLLSAVNETALLHRLVDGGHVLAAGRLAGALRRMGRGELASEIVRAMRAAEFDVRETNPFDAHAPALQLERNRPPIVGRLQALWASQRQAVLDAMPAAPGLPADPPAYLAHVDDVYRNDAYNSLSIEGYSVTPELIERVRSGVWSPESSEVDRKNIDAMAARGYWQAFQAVKSALSEVLHGADDARVARAVHGDWYVELFSPAVSAGIIRQSALAGYRNNFVYLRTSRYVPPAWEVVRDAMAALFDLLESEPEPAVRAVLGHWLFGYVHPYSDGNGRIARFLMNLFLASGGYPWTIIKVDDRAAYLRALDTASIDHDAGPFARFIAEQVKAA